MLADELIEISLDGSRVKGFMPLRESEDGLLGQIGWMPWPHGGLEPVYAPNLQQKEIISEATGKKFLWRCKTHCLGVPVGTCQKRIKEGGGSYCAECEIRHDLEGDQWRAGTKRNNIINDGITGQWIPSFFSDWKAPSLTPEQMAPFVVLQNHDLQCAWIIGKHGRGKTTLALCLMEKYLKHCRKVAFLTAQLLRECQQNKYLYNGFVGADLLVIDDLPKGIEAAWLVGTLHSILDDRHQPKRRTIVTSEMTNTECTKVFSGLNPVMGASTLDRLNFHGAPCIVVEISGESLRR